MKKTNLLAVLLVGVFSLTACDSKPAEPAKETKTKEGEAIKNKINDAADKVKQANKEANDKLEEAVNE